MPRAPGPSPDGSKSPQKGVTERTEGGTESGFLASSPDVSGSRPNVHGSEFQVTIHGGGWSLRSVLLEKETGSHSQWVQEVFQRYLELLRGREIYVCKEVVYSVNIILIRTFQGRVSTKQTRLQRDSHGVSKSVLRILHLP